MEQSLSLAFSVETSSTKKRIRIFRSDLPLFLHFISEKSDEFSSQLVDLIFMTLYIYYDRGSRRAVDDVIKSALKNNIFIDKFAKNLVQAMEEQLKHSHVGCVRFMNWSCLLLCNTTYSETKDSFLGVANAQALCLQVSLQGSSRERKACRRTFKNSFLKSPDIFSLYMEELKAKRILIGKFPEMLRVLLDYSSSNMSVFNDWKLDYVNMYEQAVLTEMDTATKSLSESLSEAFGLLFVHLTLDDFKMIGPKFVRMLRRNCEHVLDSIGISLRNLGCDLGNFGVSILEEVLSQTWHANEVNKLAALDIIRCLSQKSKDPDIIKEMVYAVIPDIESSGGKPPFRMLRVGKSKVGFAPSNERVGMIYALQELSRFSEKIELNAFSCTVCDFLMGRYAADEIEEVKLACLTALASWVARSTDAIGKKLFTFIDLGLKEKGSLRGGHLRCIRVIYKDAHASFYVSSLASFIEIVQAPCNKKTQRLDAIYALLIVVKMAAANIKEAEEKFTERFWNFIAKNVPSVLDMASDLPVDDCETCIDLLKSLLLYHSPRRLDILLVKSLMKPILTFLCHSSWNVRKAAQDSTNSILSVIHESTKRSVSVGAELFQALLDEYFKYLTVVGEQLIAKSREEKNSSNTQLAYVPYVEILVNALMVISSSELAATHVCSMRLLFCSHHPCLVGTTNKKDTVWKRLQRDVHVQAIKDYVTDFCEIFRTHEVMLLSEQAKGRFKAYQNNDSKSTIPEQRQGNVQSKMLPTLF